jgi:hypothetical protein
MRTLLVLFLLAHAVAHLVGFAGAFRLSPTIPHETALLAGHVRVSEAAVRAVGVLWLAAATGFVASALGMAVHAPWWRPLTLAIATLSLALSVAQWPAAWVGAVIDVAVIGLALTAPFGWPLARSDEPRRASGPLPREHRGTAAVVAGEPRLVAQVLTPRSAIGARATRPAEPRRADAGA